MRPSVQNKRVFLRNKRKGGGECERQIQRKKIGACSCDSYKQNFTNTIHYINMSTLTSEENHLRRHYLLWIKSIAIGFHYWHPNADKCMADVSGNSPKGEDEITVN